MEQKLLCEGSNFLSLSHLFSRACLVCTCSSNLTWRVSCNCKFINFGGFYWSLTPLKLLDPILKPKLICFAWTLKSVSLFFGHLIADNLRLNWFHFLSLGLLQACSHARSLLLSEGETLYSRALRAGSHFLLVLLSNSDRLDCQQLEPADFPVRAARGLESSAFVLLLAMFVFADTAWTSRACCSIELYAVLP